MCENLTALLKEAVPHHDDSGSVSSPPKPRWYCLNKIGMATLCADATGEMKCRCTARSPL